MAGSSRSWGWHRLDPRFADRLVADAGLPPGALVLDVGAGTGAVTEPLLRAGLRVIAVEAHPGRAAALRRRFGSEVTVVQADAADLRLPRQPFHVVANPPYGITTPLLRRLLQRGTRLESAHLVVQQQAAQRWTGPRAPGAARWGSHHTAALGRRIPRAAFAPRPQVDSRVLVLSRR